VVEALWLLGQPGMPAGTWNVAAGRRTKILDLADVVEQACGSSLRRQHGPRRPGDVTSSAISARRLRTFGWRPRVGLAAGIRELLLATAREPDVPGEEDASRWPA
jgi:nucleoside-diphosphate-sugar epimerase